MRYRLRKLIVLVDAFSLVILPTTLGTSTLALAEGTSDPSPPGTLIDATRTSDTHSNVSLASDPAGSESPFPLAPDASLPPPAIGDPVAETRTSLTYSLGGGSYEALVYPETINFVQPSEGLEPVVNDLVPVPGPDPDFENAANRFSVQLPPSLSSGVTFSRSGVTLSMSLEGASAMGSITGNSATYADALPGVDLEYRVTNESLKESMTLASPTAPTQFRFLLTGENFTLSQLPNGAIDVRNATSGALVFTLPPPIVTDRTGTASSEAATQQVSGTPNGTYLDLDVDPAWLEESGRQWPVVLDPGATVSGASPDCWFQNGTSGLTQSCSTTGLNVGINANGTRKAIMTFTLPTLPAGYTITSAPLMLSLTAENNSHVIPISVSRVTSQWNSGVTWASTGLASWTNAGGDFADPTVVNASTGGVLGPYSWDISNLVSGWLAHTYNNNGILIQEGAGSDNNILTFGATESSQPPVLVINYTVGDQTPPSGPLTSPTNDAVVSGAVTLAASPTDVGGSGVASTSFYATQLGVRKLLGTDSTLADGQTLSLDTTRLADGPALISAEYTDNAGNTSSSPPSASAYVLVSNSSPGPEPWQATYSGYDYPFAADGELQVQLRTGALLLHIGEPSVVGEGFDPSLDLGYDSAWSTQGNLGPGWRASFDGTIGRESDGTLLFSDSQLHQSAFAPQVGAGLKGLYWSNENQLGSPVLGRTDATVAFDWSGGAPGPGVPQTGFSSQWTGFVTLPNSGVWQFFASGTDGVRLVVDGAMVLSRWASPTSGEVSGSLNLGAGRHQIELDYFDHQAPAKLTLSFSGPGTTKQVIPAGDLSQATGQYISPPGVFETLTSGSDGTLTATDQARTIQTFGPDGSLTSISDLDGNQLTYVRNQAGQATAICVNQAPCPGTSPAYAFSYDTAGRLASALDAAGRTTSFVYDASGHLQQITDPAGALTTFAYSSTGLLQGITGPLGPPMAIGYDSSNRVTSITDPYALSHGGPSTMLTYQGTPASSVTVFSPNAMAQSPRGPGKDYTLGSSGEQLGWLDPGASASWAIGYDSNHNVVSVTDPAGNHTSRGFDSMGNLVSETDALGNVATSTYDSMGNMLSHTDALGDTSSYTYNSRGDMVSETDPASRTTTLGVSATGETLSSTDSVGSATSISYDSFGNPTQVTDATGATTLQTFDRSGNAVSVTDPAGATTHYTYSPSNYATSVVLANGAKTTAQYNGVGEMVSTVGPLGNASGGDPATYTASTSYDSDGRAVSSTDVGGGTTLSAYDWDGNLVSSTDTSGHTTTMTYGPDDQLEAVVSPSGVVVSEATNDLGETTGVTTPSGTWQFSYDAAGHVLSQTDPTGAKTSYSYDAAGNQVTETLPNGNLAGAPAAAYTTTYHYNRDGVQTASTDALGRSVTAAYDAAGNLTGVTDPSGTTTSYGYDGLGRLTSTHVPGSSWHSSAGTLAVGGNATVTVTAATSGVMSAALTTSTGTAASLSVLDSSGATVATAVQDPTGLVSVTKAIGPGTYTLKVQATSGAPTWHLDYSVPSQAAFVKTVDAAGNETTFTSPLGTVQMTYDALGNLTQQVLPGGATTTYSYDTAGNLQSLADPTGTQSVTYTPSGLLSTSTDQVGTTSQFTYNASAQLVSQPSATFGYDSFGRLNHVGIGSLSINSTYADGLNPTDLSLSDGETEHRSYDALARITGLQVTQAGGATALSRQCSYDPDGNPVSVLNTVNPQAPTSLASFAYDGLDRLSSETNVVNGLQQTSQYSYDLQGNISSVTQGGQSTSYTYNPGGQLVRSVGPGGGATAYFYDDAGDLSRVVTASGTSALTWRADEMPSTVTLPNGTTGTYTFDSSGQRTSKIVNGVTTAYSWANGNLTKISSPSATATFAYDPAGLPLTMTVGGVTYVYHMDPEGSVVAVTNATSGQVAATYQYDAYGNTIASSGSQTVLAANPYRFRGAEDAIWDAETGWYLMGARMFDPATRRFLSPDPEGGFTPYAYADANPLAESDPTGLNSVLTSGVETNKKIREASHGVDPLVITHYIPNVDAWIHNHYKGKPEVFYTWPWSRDPHEIFNLVASVLRRWLRGLDKQPQPLLVTFRSSVNKICEAVDADNAPCNLIGHSFGGIMTAFAVGRGINSKGHGVSYEATLAAPFNWYAQNGKAFWNYPGVHFAGDYANFTEKAPVLKLWSNSTNKINSLTPLSIQVPTFEDNGYANFQAHTNLHHADFWADNATIARVTALGICLARKHYYEWGGNALCHKS